MNTHFAPPIHPGEILREEYLAPLHLKPYTLAKRLNVPRTRIERLVAEHTPVTPDTALRLGRFFGTTPQFWMNMQAGFDIAVEAKAKMADLEKIEPLTAENFAEARLSA
ncbi:HigA family addiction module antidote protein [Mesorhizobium sp. CGMCC 1.15528]|uniref:HigA family addiction module antidote protein n=1 Tax=Mesorhizobium zhangyense TaxID=1776730 RepID=A0A7C9REU5_9HYPH|nr:HigA family addiction module antitoxin [Mesorhizobium zhangyense]NGN44913.1 HigA family addiction module antidote protein [Mesorhizobium zhangyense]